MPNSRAARAAVWVRGCLAAARAGAGVGGFFLDLVERPDWVHFLCRKFTDFYVEDYTRAAEITTGRIDLYLVISDLGASGGR